MTKQIKKATATKKQNKKATAKKEALKTFLDYTNDGKTIKEALILTRATRQKFLTEVYATGNNADQINTIANKWGYSKKVYDMMASYPLKSDIAKLNTITPFVNKTREVLTPRMTAALVIAYLNRDDEKGFSRVFPSGLFLENGCLTDLLTGGYIKHKDGEGEKQRFLFNLDKIESIIQSKEYATLEKTMADACQI